MNYQLRSSIPRVLALFQLKNKTIEEFWRVVGVSQTCEKPVSHYFYSSAKVVYFHSQS
jgi:hypothetical protein